MSKLTFNNVFWPSSTSKSLLNSIQSFPFPLPHHYRIFSCVHCWHIIINFAALNNSVVASISLSLRSLSWISFRSFFFSETVRRTPRTSVIPRVIGGFIFLAWHKNAQTGPYRTRVHVDDNEMRWASRGTKENW